MAVVVSLAFGVILVRLYGLQILEGADFRAKSRNNFFHFERLDHARGEIVDREARVLVSNRPSVNVAVTPAFFPPATRTVVRLGATCGLARRESKEIASALSKVVQEKGPPILLARDLSRAQTLALRKMQARLEIPLEAVPILEMGADPSLSSQVDDRYAAYIDPTHFPSTGRVLNKLEELMGLTDKELKLLKKRIRRARGLDRYLDIIVRRDVPPQIEGRLSLEVQLGQLPGVSVRRAKARIYRYGQLAAHLLGYVNELSSEELEEKRELGYRLGDAIGRRGVEKTFEGELRGIDGQKTVVVDSKGRSQVSTFARALQKDVGEFKPPKPGNRVVLTIDLDIQKAAETAFNGTAGAVVVMEAATGRLLALTSTPSFDPNKLAGYFDPKEKKRLDSMRALRPWRFRAIQDYFAPGSTFKVVTALAAYQAGVTRLGEHVNCPGAYRLGNTRFRCWKDSGHGAIDVHLSLARSCDVYYYTMGARMGLDPIAKMAKSMGFGKPTGVALAGESRGIMPDKAWYNRHLPPYTLGAAVNASIGQGAVAVTPIQLAVAYAALANGGTVFEPQVVQRIESYDGKAVRELPPKPLRRIDMPPEALAAVREGLRQVVNEPFGTAFRKRLKDLQVAGKTGTAQVAKLGKKRIRSRDLPWKLRDHAWFSAIAPAEDPEVVVIVFNEHGGGGSSTAAPIAMKVIQAWYDKYQKPNKEKEQP